jgi:hypothetical protein
VEAQEVVALVTLADLAEVQHKVQAAAAQVTATLAETVTHHQVAVVVVVVVVLVVVEIQAEAQVIIIAADQAVVDDPAIFLEEL